VRTLRVPCSPNLTLGQLPPIGGQFRCWDAERPGGITTRNVVTR